MHDLERFLISLDSEHGAAGIHQLGEEELASPGLQPTSIIRMPGSMPGLQEGRRVKGSRTS
jgi:hypothetical protein